MSNKCCIQNPCDARTHHLPMGEGISAIDTYTPPKCLQTQCGSLDSPMTYTPYEPFPYSFFKKPENYHCGIDKKDTCADNTMSTQFRDESAFRNGMIHFIKNNTNIFEGV